MERIGRYRIIGELGAGAMGIVYHATDPSIGRSVAIKTIRIRDINDTQKRDKLRERLFREARSAGVLSHPNIVTIYDMDEADGLAYIAMAYVNGPTLEKILSSEAPLSGANMLRILRQAASALDYAHGRGIVHRDVKPANIMTDEDGAVKITDFGIAKIAAVSNVTETRTVVGTPNYMSPEQVQGLPVDGRSDQFSLAVIAYEILTGERPFAGEHLSTVV
jgi:serine/threonine protein kinase